MTRILALSALLVAGCGYSYDAFSEDETEALCNKMDECGMLDTIGWSLEDCLNSGESDTGGESDWECEDYDPGAAKDCVEATENISCEDFMSGQGLEVCDDVCSNYGE